MSIGKSSLRVLSLVCLAFFLVMATGCGKKKKGKMTGSVGVANTVTSTSALWGDDVLNLNSGNGESSLDATYNERSSFNPSSLKMTLTSVQLCKKGNDGYDANGNLGCADTRNSVKLTGSKEIELMGQPAFSALEGLSADNFDKSEFGTYVLAMIGYDGFASFSGTTSLDGTTQTITNAQVGSGSGISVRLPVEMTVDDSHSPNLQIFFDVHAPAYIFNSLAGSSPAGSVLVSDTYHTGLSNWSMLAYLGGGTPSLESYNVTLSTTDFGSSGTPLIRVSVLKDDAGKFYTATWHAEYVNLQEPLTTPFNICNLDPLLTKDNGDGTYLLSSNTDSKFCQTTFGASYVYLVKFANFQLATHTGTVTIGPNTYSYTATKN